ncbi:MAG: hypothetical protein JRH17_04090 [Deltaproteobacteria bacterium]|jgi:hypothetical protein|nr:hypothetical protein [Deltaproteobacteria bacterium]
MTDSHQTLPRRDGDDGGELRCDFCDRVVSGVRRVALDGDYERLRTPHAERYACPTCFEKKDHERLTGAQALASSR